MQVTQSGENQTLYVVLLRLIVLASNRPVFFYPRCHLNQVIKTRDMIRKIILYTTTSVLHWLCLHVCCPRAGFFFATKMNLATSKERIDSALHTHNNYLVLHFTY